MAWTTEDLATIEAAIASGVRKIKFSDREMEFPSIAELRATRQDIQNYLSSVSGVPQVRMVRMYTRNGF